MLCVPTNTSTVICSYPRDFVFRHLIKTQSCKVSDLHGRCHVSGFQLTDYRSNDRRFYSSLDRLDSTKGYIKGNVRLVCIPFNVTDSTSKKKRFDEMDGDQNWSFEAFKKYIGVS